MKSTFQMIGVVVLILGGIFALGFFGLGWNKFFLPKYENVRRETYENTQSFVEGKQQDLAKYYLEYQQTEDPESREAIKVVIQSQFSYFDADKVSEPKLRQFLINMRGF